MCIQPVNLINKMLFDYLKFMALSGMGLQV